MAEPFNETDAVRAEWFKQHSERSIDRSDDAGHIPQLEPDGFLHGGFVRQRYDVPTYFPVDASAVPQAAFIDTDGTVLPGKADVSGRAKFTGFLFEDYSGQTPAVFLNGNTYTASGGSFTLNAGTDRVVYMTFLFTTSSGSPTMPTSVEWNGHTLTKVPGSEVVSGTSGIAVWRYVAGSGGTNETGNIVYSGQAGTNPVQNVYADAYQLVDQSTPEDVLDTSTSTSGGSVADSVTPTQSYSLAFNAVVNRTGNAITLSGFMTERHANSPSTKFGDGYLTVAAVKSVGAAYSSTTEHTNSITVVLRNSTSTEAKLIYGGILPGFSGLTPGLRYYLSDTEGAVSTTPGTTEVLVGKAVSTTELLIIH